MREKMLLSVCVEKSLTALSRDPLCVCVCVFLAENLL